MQIAVLKANFADDAYTEVREEEKFDFRFQYARK